jgi:predicted lipoprotein with Yx(FWY)xxD motif
VRRLGVLLVCAGALTLVPAPAGAVAAGTKISLRDSSFGKILFGPKRQAIYVFQRDRRNRSRCLRTCAELWPPVFTRGKPLAGKGVRRSLLGSIRRGKRRQVTYRGRPLYFYAHEGPDEVKCHNVFLNGGLWWVLGPDGRRR